MATSDPTCVQHLLDAGSFERSMDSVAPSDPIGFPGYADLLKETAERSQSNDSVIAGAATVGGHRVEVAAFDFSFLGGSMGAVAGETVARAMERAAARRVPFVLRAATGGARMQEGMRALVQMPKLVAARTRVTAAQVPYLAVLGDPSTGGVLASIGGLADYTVAEAGATVGFAGPRVVETVTGALPSAGSHNASSAAAHGLVDVVVQRGDVRDRLTSVLEALAADEPEPVSEPPRPVDDEPDPWDAVQLARAGERPKAPDLADAIAPGAVTLAGDRAGSDDSAVSARLGRVLGRRVLIVALDRSHLVGPGGFRKARRCLGVAARLGLPVVTLVDTPGADPSESSEAAGIAWQIAALFEAMLAAPVPILCVVTGEGGSGGALAFAAGDRLLIYEHAIFSVIAPEAAAAILWRDRSRAAEAARALDPTARRLVELGIADALVAEPVDPTSLAKVLAYHLDDMSHEQKDLVASRRDRWRTRG